MAKKKEETLHRASAAVKKNFNLGNFKKKKGFKTKSKKNYYHSFSQKKY